MNDDGRDWDDPAQKDDVGLNQGIEEMGDLILGGGGGALFCSFAGLIVGGPVAALAGAGLGTLAGTALAVSVTSGWHEPSFREHHESFHPQGGRNLDQASHAYRYGWEGHDRPELRGKSWSEARPGLERGWTGPGPYPEYEPYIKYAWERRASTDVEPKFPGEA